MNSTNESYFHPIVMDIGSYGSGQALPVGRGRIQKHIPPGIPAIFRILRIGNIRSRYRRTPPKDSQETMQQFHHAQTTGDHIKSKPKKRLPSFPERKDGMSMDSHLLQKAGTAKLPRFFNGSRQIKNPAPENVCGE